MVAIVIPVVLLNRLLHWNEDGWTRNRNPFYIGMSDHICYTGEEFILILQCDIKHIIANNLLMMKWTPKNLYKRHTYIMLIYPSDSQYCYTKFCLFSSQKYCVVYIYIIPYVLY